MKILLVLVFAMCYNVICSDRKKLRKRYTIQMRRRCGDVKKV